MIDRSRRIYMVTDLHFGVRNNSIFWKDEMVKFFDWFIQDIKDNGFDPATDSLLVLGDVFNSRESVNIMILDEVIGIFQELSAVFGLGVHIITGNHDTYYVDSNSVSSVSILDRVIPNLVEYKSPLKVNVSGKSCLLMPWITSYEDIHSLLVSDDSDYLFCHADINGMKYSSGIEIDKCVSRDITSKYKHVFSGHIHIRQSSGNVTYLGTPYQIDTGDIGNVKGYHYIDTSDFSLHFFENKVSPVFKVVNVYDILESSLPEVKSLLCNCFVDVYCDSSIYNNIDLVLFRKKLIDLGVGFIKMEFTEVKNMDETTDVTSVLSDFKFDILDSSVSLLRRSKKSDSEIDEIMSCFNNLYKKVLLK